MYIHWGSLIFGFVCGVLSAFVGAFLKHARDCNN